MQPVCLTNRTALPAPLYPGSLLRRARHQQRHSKVRCKACEDSRLHWMPLLTTTWISTITAQNPSCGAAVYACMHSSGSQLCILKRYKMALGCQVRVTCLLWRSMQRFLQFRLGPHSLPVAAGFLLALLTLPRLTECVWPATVVLLGNMMHLVVELATVLLLLLCGLGMQACSQAALMP